MATWTIAEINNLTIEGEHIDGALVAKAAGRIDGGNAREFQSALETLLTDDITALLLNFEGLAYISSAGLRVILPVFRQMERMNAKFGVCSLSPSIGEVFQISGFDKIIPTHAAQTDALSSFGS